MLITRIEGCILCHGIQPLIITFKFVTKNGIMVTLRFKANKFVHAVITYG